MSIKRLRLLVLAIVVLLAIGLPWWLAGPRRVPEGQPALATIDVSMLQLLREEFNRSAADTTRVIVLLAPT